jgi:hypothetical protein
MLITEALNLLTPSITALPWVDIFGGVVQRIDVPTADANGNTFYKSIPVACGATIQDCKNQRYQPLNPDSNKYSVLFFEVTQPLSDLGSWSGDQNRRRLEGRARLIYWINAAKLGQTECNTAAKAMRSLLPIFYKDFRITDSNSPFYNSAIRFEFAGEAIKDSSIFGRYSFSDNKDGFLLYPYDYGAMDINIIINQALCDIPFTPSVEIECKDYSNP